MVDGLFGGELGNWGKDGEGVTSQEDNIVWVACYCGDLGILDEFEGVTSTSVFGD